MISLEDYLHSINPQPDEQHILFYGKKYKCWLKGKYIGVFTWTKDENVGDSFQQRKGERIRVATPDKWEIIIKK